MKKILFINDASDYHCGSALTCKILVNLIKNYNCSVDRFKTGSYPNDIKEYDLVIINGEGSFHHNNFNAKNIYSFAKRVKDNNKKVCLINTVIQNISYDLSIFDFISVRESKSALGKYSIVHDACFYNLLDNTKNSDQYVLFIDSVFPNITKNIIDTYKNFEGPKKYISMTSGVGLENFIQLCQNASCIVSGRYHGVVFAIMCNKKFIALESNTHKISGLLLDLCLVDNLHYGLDDIQDKINISVQPQIDYLNMKNNIENMINNCISYI